MSDSMPNSATLGSSAESEILALIDSLHQAHRDKNAAGIAAPYAPNAAIFDLSPPLAHPGVTVERKQPWLDTWDTGIDLESRDLRITVAGNHAFAWGYQRMSGTPRAAGRPISFWMRVTYAFERIGGAWRIVHEHNSVPFYMDGSLRPAFDLQP
jgi:ketosteroid isomerase-like protein